MTVRFYTRLPSRLRARVFGLALVLAALVLAADFARFVSGALAPPAVSAIAATAAAPADGIVVLTGGTDRIDEAFHLLAEGRAARLLVSGVGHHAGIPDLARAAGIDPARITRPVTLDHVAASTRDNASETAEWARAYALHTVIVVTSSYHMPRALLELQRAAPDLVLLPDAVRPRSVREADGLPNAATWRVLTEEYAKFLLVRTGLA